MYNLSKVSSLSIASKCNIIVDYDVIVIINIT